MIPIRLKIKGLYSYQEEQMIDFGKLVDANIFGVFGSVGSGKSTILEAISYALYGEVDRMNRAGRNYNMLNLKSNELLIDFEFRNFEDIEYRVLVKGKRNSKQFGDVKPFTKTAYQKINKEWEAIENFERDVEQIVGLSYINFRRTIIIPQGKFQEFLQLGSKDRTEMLKEIFNLGKFDLSSKTAAIDSANEAKLQAAQGSLQQLEEYTEDVVSQFEKEITAKQAELSILVDKQKKKKQEYEEQKLIKELSDKLKSTQQEFEKLALQKPHIEQLELSLKNFNLYTRLFKSDLDFCKHKKNSIDEKNQRLSGIDKSLEDKHKTLGIKKQAFAEVERQKENIPTLTKQAEEYRMLVQMQESSDKIAKLKQRREKGRETIEETKRNKNILEEKLKEQKDKNKVFTKKQEEYFKLKEKELAVNKFLSLNTDLQKIKDKEREQLGAVASKQLELRDIVSKFNIAGKDIPSELKDMTLKLSEKIDRLNDEKSSLLIHRELGGFVNQLHDGKACPLCGSAEHPKVLAVENVDDELAALTAKMDRSIQEKQELEKAELNSLSISEAISTLKKELLDLDIQIKERATEVDTQRELLLASGGEKLAPDEIKSHIQQLSAELEKLKIITRNIENTEKELEESNSKLEKYREAISVFEKDLSYEEGQFNSMQAKLALLRFEDYAENKGAASMAADLEKKISSIEEAYGKLAKETENLATELAELNSTKKELEGNIDVEKKDLENAERKLDANLYTQGIDNLETVLSLLNSDFDADTAEKQINEYHSKYSPIEKKVQELRQELGDKIFDDEKFALLGVELQDIETGVAACNKALAQIEQQIKTTKEKLQEKARLSTEKEDLELRKSDIDILKKMFRSNGFVDFVSSVYLKNLCQSANKRFAHLTKQQLHLELNEANEFIVRDNMNEGRTRSVRSLSGGQMFQASLSLALSLAESVQTQNKQDRNFFFLDEGFGTLDKDTLRQVFNTLKSLRNENRVVGIISHVEELQQEIPVHLKIYKDTERGSVIETSY